MLTGTVESLVKNTLVYTLLEAVIHNLLPNSISGYLTQPLVTNPSFQPKLRAFESEQWWIDFQNNIFGPTVSILTLLTTIISAACSGFVVLSLIFFPTHTSTLHLRKPSIFTITNKDRTQKQLENPRKTALIELIYPIIFFMFLADFLFSLVSLPAVCLYVITNRFYGLQNQPEYDRTTCQPTESSGSWVLTTFFVAAAEIIEIIYASSCLWSFLVTLVIYWMFQETLKSLINREKNLANLSRKTYFSFPGQPKNDKSNEFKPKVDVGKEKYHDEDENTETESNPRLSFPNDRPTSTNLASPAAEGLQFMNNSEDDDDDDLSAATPGKFRTSFAQEAQLLGSNEEDLLVQKSKQIDDIKRRYLIFFHCFTWGAPMLFGFPFLVVFVADIFLCEKELWARLFILITRLMGDIGKTFVYILLEIVSLFLRTFIFVLSLRIKKKVPIASQKQQSQIHIFSQLLGYFFPFLVCTLILIACRGVYMTDLFLRYWFESPSIDQIHMDFRFQEIVIIGVNRFIFPLRGMLDAFIYVYASNVVTKYFASCYKCTCSAILKCCCSCFKPRHKSRVNASDGISEGAMGGMDLLDSDHGNMRLLAKQRTDLSASRNIKKMKKKSESAGNQDLLGISTMNVAALEEDDESSDYSYHADIIHKILQDEN